MDKNEFLTILREQLDGLMPTASIEDNVRYYDQYISEQIASGKSQDQVMEELGSPILIAKTLTDVAESRAETVYESNQYEEEDAEYADPNVRTFHMSAGMARWLIPVALVLIFTLITVVLGTVAAVLIKYFLPIMLVLLVIYVVRTFTGSGQ